MIRSAVGETYKEKLANFRFRGKEPGRLENFSDAVFALAVTLLLISTTPPTNFDQIKIFIFDLIPFTLCITLIILIWHEHFVFFYRYGLRNRTVVALNTLFLIIVLFYVYPLKFLTRLILIPIAYILDHEGLKNIFTKSIRYQDMADLMIIYGLGAASVFLVLVGMYRYALKQSEELGLNEIEKFDTRMSIRANVLMAIVPMISVLIAIIFRKHEFAGLFAGLTYFIYTPIMIFHGILVDRNRLKVIDATPLQNVEVNEDKPDSEL